MPGVTIEWSTAYASGDPIAHYDIYRSNDRIGSMPYQPQTTEAPFSFTDTAGPGGNPTGAYYRIRTVDVTGRYVDSISVRA